MIPTNAAGMFDTPEGAKALIAAVRTQSDDSVFGNALRDACRATAFVVVKRVRHNDFATYPVGVSIPLSKAYRVVDVIPAEVRL